MFVNHSAAAIAETVEAANLDVIQLHGDERPDFIEAIRQQLASSRLDQTRPSSEPSGCQKTWAGTRAHPSFNREVASWKQAGAAMVLLDAAVPGSFGGTGARLDWNALRGISLDLPFALAGGLNPENVADAISIAQPDAVDAASGVENSTHAKKTRTP